MVLSHPLQPKHISHIKGKNTEKESHADANFVHWHHLIRQCHSRYVKEQEPSRDRCHGFEQIDVDSRAGSVHAEPLHL